MHYQKKPEMILFDVGGTLFDDGKCIFRDGLSALRRHATNPEITDDDTLEKLWFEHMATVEAGLSENKGVSLDLPLSAGIKYVTMKSGLHFDITVSQQEEIFDRFNSSRRLLGGIEELLQTLKEENIRTAVISNNAMSGEGLQLAVKRWIPSSEFEFCLTSADILLPKPGSQLFTCAASYAGVSPDECFYCGDGRIPDVDGARNGGMHPVLIDTSSDIPLEFRTDGGKGRYMTVNHWNVLSEYIKNLQG